MRSQSSVDKMDDIDLKQGSDEWRRARAGSLGAASVHDALAKGARGQWLSGREKVMQRLITERLTGVPADGYRSPAMQWGIDKEPEARAKYAETHGRVIEVGLLRHPTIDGAHASPDGICDDLGMVEIKCLNTANHVEILTSELIPPEYVTQMQWQMACAPAAEWCDFVSYDPRVAPALQLYVQTVLRDRQYIAQLEAGVREFLAEMQVKLDALAEQYGDISPPPYVDPMSVGFDEVPA